MALVNQMFGAAGRIAIPGLNLRVDQLPYVGIGLFGLFIYFMYAHKASSDIGEKKEYFIGLFMLFGFLFDIFMFSDVWLVTVVGLLAGVYALLAFAGVFGMAKKMGKLGLGLAEVAHEKRQETKAKKKEAEEAALVTRNWGAEIQEDREETNLIERVEKEAITKISKEHSYFANIAYGQQNISALTHILTCLRRIVQILELKKKASARIGKLEKKEEKVEKKEEKEEKKEETAEQKEAVAEDAEIKQLVADARLLPLQMRQQVQTAVAELQQARAGAMREKVEEAQELAGQNMSIQLEKMQIRIAKELNTIQGNMLNICKGIEKNLSNIESAMAKGGKKREAAISGYPPVKFINEFGLLVAEHNKINQVMQRAIQEEITGTLAKIRTAMAAQHIDVTNLNEDVLLEKAETIKGNIDRILGGKRTDNKKDITVLREGAIEIGITAKKKILDQAYLQNLRNDLAYLQRMRALITPAAPAA